MSKRILHHPEVPAGEATVAWRSAGQLEDTAEFRQWMDREFPRGAAEMANEEEVETSRRSFLKLMGASTALAGFGMAACRRPESYIVPYTKAPEWVIPGKATYYASSMPRATGATPLVVTTFEGRPTKLSPNKLHPDAEGTDAFAQASILDLYSPSRSRGFLKSGEKATRAEFQALLTGLAADKAAKIGFLFGADDSPTRNSLTKVLATKFGGAKFYQYEALTGDASTTSLGDGVKLMADFAKADRIVSLDCDFAGTDSQGPVTPFFDRRKPEGKGYESAPDEKSMNRLYSVEAAFTLTGGMADHRLRVTPSQVNAVAAQIARELGVKAAVAAAVPPLTDPHQIQWVAGLVEDLQKSVGKSAVLAGSRQSLSVHLIASEINLFLQNIGEGKPLVALQKETAGLGSLEKLKSDLDSGAVEVLVVMTPSNPIFDAPADLKFGESFAKLKTSIHWGTRTDATAHASSWHVPAAHYLESWSDARSAKGVYTVVQPMILPLYQDCVSELELLLAFLPDDGKLLNGEGEKGAASPAYDAVRSTFEGIGVAGDAAWKKLLRDGFFAGSAYPLASVSPKGDMSAPFVSTVASKDSLEVIFATDASIFDGRWIDNGWLQESPDPISKLTWDNVALIAPKTAKELGVYNQVIATETSTASRSPDDEGENRKSPMITITVNGVTLDIPVLVSFGQAENTIVIPLGYGQGFDEHDVLERGPKNSKHVGLVGVNRGFNAYPLRTSADSYFATGATVKLIAGKRYPVAITQEHSAMYGRALAREVSTKDDTEKGSFQEQLANVPKQGNDSHAPPNISLYKPQTSATFHPNAEGKPDTFLSDPLHQWGMSIDLSSCMGCSACTVACQSENNIPIVGKDQVARGREMHWIRMDRYFATQKYDLDEEGNKIPDANGPDGYKKAPDWALDNPALVPQPVACVQCESAPCETVCPVNATVHTEDGLNAMAYNRCIGTRYCANNCPYKARRFNYFDYNKRNPLIAHNLYKGPFGEKTVGEAAHLQKNPNVTVRMRGVMEKCTYCVQRLKDSVIRQKRGQKQEVLAAGKPSTEVQVTIETLRIPVDSVKTACQDACPADAISFGNLLDADSRMVRAKGSHFLNVKGIARSYDLLNYIGTLPRTSYLARVKNPNPKMPDAKFIGKATINMA
jgi:MoCo/4Fe-4S cofactor protein with predicted Tat translocation signal